MSALGSLGTSPRKPQPPTSSLSPKFLERKPQRHLRDESISLIYYVWVIPTKLGTFRTFFSTEVKARVIFVSFSSECIFFSDCPWKGASRPLVSFFCEKVKASASAASAAPLAATAASASAAADSLIYLRTKIFLFLVASSSSSSYSGSRLGSSLLLLFNKRGLK